MRKTLNIKIRGKVQGVFFRASTKEKADSLDIHGFVRNEPDGSVYIEAEGEEDKLLQFTEWCQHGPPHARVENCDVNEGISKAFSRFGIER